MTINYCYFLALLFVKVYGHLSNCTEECDQLDTGPQVLYCGTDLQNHWMTYTESQTDVMYCYRYSCGITAIYPGYCACPNSCFISFQQGKCIRGQRCQCQPGFTGDDCSLVECNHGNPCVHGKCMPADDNHLYDYCLCEEEATGQLCTIKKNDLDVLPYGEVFGGRPYYTQADKYGDTHPLFNISVLANVYITTSPSDLTYLLNPSNAFNQSFVPATFYFDNGNIVEKIDDVLFHLKGRHTRTMLKKSWKVKFPRKFYGMSKLSLKYPFPDATSIRGQLTEEFLRAMKVPTSRSSYASLWINGIHWGLFWMHEEFDFEFIRSRYKSPKGDLYKCGSHSWLNYIGDNQTVYEDMKYFSYGAFHNNYKKKLGDNSWKSFVKLVNAIDDPDDDEKLSDILSVKRFLRNFVVEVFTSNEDGYSHNGNNYGLYKNPKSDKFEFIQYDNDYTMKNPIDDRGIYDSWPKEEAVLSKRVLSVTKWREKYRKYFVKFLKKICTDEECTIIRKRIDKLKEFLIQSVNKDFFFRLDYNRHMKNFEEEIESVKTYFPQRVKYILSQLNIC